MLLQCVNTLMGTAIHFLMHVLWNPTRDSLRRIKGEAGMWNKQCSNFNSGQAQWLEELSQEGHKFNMLKLLSKILRSLSACSLSISNLKVSVFILLHHLMPPKCQKKRLKYVTPQSQLCTQSESASLEL